MDDDLLAEKDKKRDESVSVLALRENRPARDRKGENQREKG